MLLLRRMRPCLKRIQPMPNVPLAYVSVYRRMSDIFHTLAYARTIRNSVTGPYPGLLRLLRATSAEALGTRLYLVQWVVLGVAIERN